MLTLRKCISRMKNIISAATHSPFITGGIFSALSSLSPPKTIDTPGDSFKPSIFSITCSVASIAFTPRRRSAIIVTVYIPLRLTIWPSFHSGITFAT